MRCASPTPTDSAGQARSRASTCIVKALRSEGGSSNAAWAMMHDY
jgi:hypothetical protein